MCENDVTQYNELSDRVYLKLLRRVLPLLIQRICKLEQEIKNLEANILILEKR